MKLKPGQKGTKKLVERYGDALYGVEGRKTRLIQAVIFDFDGTLVDFINADVSALRYIYRLTGASANENEFVDVAIHEIMTFHELVEQGKVDPMQMHQYRLSNTFKLLRIAWKERYVNLYKAQLLRETKPYSGTHDLLSHLKGSVKLGLISNAYDSFEQRNRLDASGLADFFDQVIISGEVGLAKPDPEIFILMSKKLCADTAECLFIGDSMQYDISGAKIAGMKTALFGNNNSLTDYEPDYRVSDVQQLTRMMDSLIPS